MLLVIDCIGCFFLLLLLLFFSEDPTQVVSLHRVEDFGQAILVLLILETLIEGRQTIPLGLGHAEEALL